MDDLSDNNIKLIKYALKKLAESTDPKSENYEHILLDIHRITYKLDNHSQLTGTDAERPVLLNWTEPHMSTMPRNKEYAKDYIFRKYLDRNKF